MAGWPRGQKDYLVAFRAGMSSARREREDMDTMMTKVQVGDVFVESWGYDQTNIDFWQVVRTTEKSVWVRPIASRREDDGNYTTDAVRPIIDGFLDPDKYGWVTGRIGKPGPDGSVRKALRSWRGNPTITMTSYSSAFLWDGERSYSETRAEFGH